MYVHMMDRALGAIVSSSAAPEGNIEAVNRFGMVSAIHEVNQWGLGQRLLTSCLMPNK